MSPLARLGLSAVAAIGAGVLVALVVAVIDLYITGHGYGSITREFIAWEPAGVHLSIGDLAMLVTMIVVGVLTWSLATKGVRT